MFSIRVRKELVGAHEATRRRVVQEKGAIARVVAAIQEGRERVEDWPIEGNGFSTLGDGLKRVYKRGRKALQDARQEPTMENLHELRKRAKYFWYHMRILESSWPQLIEALADEVHTLSDHLGDDHDLALLSRLFQEGAVDRMVSIRGLRDQEDGAERLAVLLGLIARRRKELQAAAWPLAERIYVEKPKAFVKRIAGYWRVWRT
jgi:CHAD domain-containing protein